MLSPKARGDANPILLIDEDDVKAVMQQVLVKLMRSKFII